MNDHTTSTTSILYHQDTTTILVEARRLRSAFIAAALRSGISAIRARLGAGRSMGPANSAAAQ